MPREEPSNLWRLALSGRPIDVHAWQAALEQQGSAPPHDVRTRLLIRDGLNAMSAFWPSERIASWLNSASAGTWLREVWQSDLGATRFPSLPKRLMEATKPDTVMQFFRALGESLKHPARLEVGGSIALILRDLLARHTEDIDVVDEVPSALRSDHALMQRLSDRFGLHVAHFQSHYLPAGWHDRLSSLGRFGRIDVYLIDAYDVLLGKLFSAREKDQDDLRAVAGLIDKQVFASRLQTAGKIFLAEPKLAEHAKANWYIVYGEPLPTSS